MSCEKDSDLSNKYTYTHITAAYNTCFKITAYVLEGTV